LFFRPYFSKLACDANRCLPPSVAHPLTTLFKVDADFNLIQRLLTGKGPEKHLNSSRRSAYSHLALQTVTWAAFKLSITQDSTNG
jgi:hypothetical protein